VKEKVEKDKAARAEERKKAKEEAARAKAAAEEAAKISRIVDAEDTNLTPSLIQKKTLEVVSSRGRKVRTSGGNPSVDARYYCTI
jgi:hypothetical protein